jgi:hypothetical protein
MLQPCRGTLSEQKFSRTSEPQAEVGNNSTRILLEPNEQNFVNFYPTSECEMIYVSLHSLLGFFMNSATLSNRHQTKGTIMVDAIIEALESLEKDVDLVEFLRIVQYKCVERNALHDHQTPQVTIFPTKRLVFHKAYGVNS